MYSWHEIRTFCMSLSMVMLWLAILSLLIELSFSGSELQTKGGRFYINREFMYIFYDLCTFFVTLKGH